VCCVGLGWVRVGPGGQCVAGDTSFRDSAKMMRAKWILGGGGGEEGRGGETGERREKSGERREKSEKRARRETEIKVEERR
jgi:hypothetical protein